MNSIGEILRLTTFGESHGPAIGGVLDGVPAGYAIDPEKVQQALDRRRPGTSAQVSQRRENDRVQLLSGLLDGVTLGTPIGFLIPNTDARPADYEALRTAWRPGHADYTYEAKYGIRDHRGGGRASARETACRVAAGAIASQVLEAHGISVKARVTQIGRVSESSEEAYASILDEARREGDTLGGAVSCVATGLPPGLGEPLFGKLQARLAAAMMSIPAAKAFEYGDGTAFASARGSEVADYFLPGKPVHTATNHSGGIQGGISNGEPITMRVTFKPAPTMMREVPTVNTAGQAVSLDMRGRHDVCVVPRAVPVVEAMAALTLLDALLRRQADRIATL